MTEPSFFNSFPHLDKLLAQFEELVRAATELATPNAQDDELIRCGIIGFMQHLPPDRWDFSHFEYVRVLRDDVCDDDFSLAWRQFTCLAAGYFLGMRVAGLINDNDLLLAEMHTPGFMWTHAKAFAANDATDA